MHTNQLTRSMLALLVATLQALYLDLDPALAISFFALDWLPAELQ